MSYDHTESQSQNTGIDARNIAHNVINRLRQYGHTGNLKGSDQNRDPNSPADHMTDKITHRAFNPARFKDMVNARGMA